MKKDLIYILIASLAYSYLFFRQAPGVNFLIFAILLIVFQAARNPVVFKSKTWLLTASGALLSGVGILLYGSTLAITANIIALLAMSFTAYSARNSLGIGLFHAVYSISGALVFMLLDAFDKPVTDQPANAKPKWSFSKTLFYILIPLTVLLIFFFLYRSGNNVFQEMTKEIDLSFISLEWVLFFISGSYLMYGFFRHQVIKPFQKFDEEEPNNLQKRERPSAFDSLFPVDVENKSGIVMFILLNLLLLIVNAGDVVFISGGAQLPEGMSLSDSVHQGIGALITSIIFAVLIILFYFRGRLNFITNNKYVRGLAVLWIFQNALLVASTAYRNYEYIAAHGLTYKRIGVYVYLALTIIGLVFTLIKVLNVKTNWFLVRAVSWSFFVVLVASPLIDWDRYVIGSQVEMAQQKEKTLDVYYLISLSSDSYPYIHYHLKSKEDEYISNKLERQLGRYLRLRSDNDWRSYNIRNERLDRFIDENYTSEKQENMKEKRRHSWLIEGSRI